jgi:hypothetical protein
MCPDWAHRQSKAAQPCKHILKRHHPGRHGRVLSGIGRSCLAWPVQPCYHSVQSATGSNAASTACLALLVTGSGTMKCRLRHWKCRSRLSRIRPTSRLYRGGKRTNRPSLLAA